VERHGEVAAAGWQLLLLSGSRSFGFLSTSVLAQALVTGVLVCADVLAGAGGVPFLLLVGAGRGMPMRGPACRKKTYQSTLVYSLLARRVRGVVSVDVVKRPPPV
jgi:hypothetical protein